MIGNPPYVRQELLGDEVKRALKVGYTAYDGLADLYIFFYEQGLRLLRPGGRLVLFGYTWALLHHMLGGIRHLIWDTGHGLEPAEREMLTLATLIGSVVFTLVLWIVGYLAMGGPR